MREREAHARTLADTDNHTQWSRTPSPPSSTRAAPVSPTSCSRWASTNSSGAYSEQARPVDSSQRAETTSGDGRGGSDENETTKRPLTKGGSGTASTWVTTARHPRCPDESRGPKPVLPSCRMPSCVINTGTAISSHQPAILWGQMGFCEAYPVSDQTGRPTKPSSYRPGTRVWGVQNTAMAKAIRDRLCHRPVLSPANGGKWRTGTKRWSPRRNV